MVFGKYLGVARGSVSDAVFRWLFAVVQHYKKFLAQRRDPCGAGAHAITISTGCTRQCTYCSVRLARGAVESKALSEVLAEVHRVLEQGSDRIALIGTDIADYGQDISMDLLDLLRAVVSIPAAFRLRLRNLNRRWIVARRDEFAELVQSGKIGFARIAVPSGSDRILGLMQRGYRAHDVLDSLAAIRRRCPSIVLRTQILVGFPTETDDEFRESLAVIRTGLSTMLPSSGIRAGRGRRRPRLFPRCPFPSSCGVIAGSWSRRWGNILFGDSSRFATCTPHT